MATVFDRRFRYAELVDGHYDESGLWVHESEDGSAPGLGDTVPAISVRTVRGTLQAGSVRESLNVASGSRNTGSIDVFSSERLKSRTRGGNEGGYVLFGDMVYQLDAEQVYPNLPRITHWKYTASMVPEGEIPQGVREALETRNEEEK